MWQEYIKNLKKRGKSSRIGTRHQLLGLEIGEILYDRPHRALYIKLARDWNGDELLRLAKGVAERVAVRNRGGYFMRVIAQIPEIHKILAKKKILPQALPLSPKNPRKKSGNAKL